MALIQSKTSLALALMVMTFASGVTPLATSMTWADPPAHSAAHGHSKHQNKYNDNDKDHKGDKSYRAYAGDRNDDRGERYKTDPYRWGDRWTSNAESRLRDLLIARTVSNLLTREDYARIGYQKRIPPGQLKKLNRGQPLPPGIAKQVYYLPSNVVPYLGYSARSPYRVGVYGSNVFLYNTVAGLVVDVLSGFLR